MEDTMVVETVPRKVVMVDRCPRPRIPPRHRKITYAHRPPFLSLVRLLSPYRPQQQVQSASPAHNRVPSVPTLQTHLHSLTLGLRPKLATGP